LLITDEYRAEQQQMHERYTYGVASIKRAPLVTEIINRLEVSHLLDYGCGKHTNLLKHIKPKHKLTYQAYDPAVPEFADAPIPAEMVACVDVLEHIEPHLLDNVLDHLRDLTEVVCFLTIDTGPAGKTLSDGRNAHLIQEPMDWWMPKLLARWDLQSCQKINAHAFCFIGYTKPRAIESVEGGKLSA
jgi:hypothetical protein